MGATSCSCLVEEYIDFARRFNTKAHDVWSQLDYRDLDVTFAVGAFDAHPKRIVQVTAYHEVAHVMSAPS